MSRPPTFDHDECRALYATGEWTTTALGERYGVTASRVWQIVDPERKARYIKRATAWQKAHRVPCANGCGALVHGQYRPGAFCTACAAERRRTSVRPTELCCVRCKLWKADRAFPRNRAEPHRRGRHTTCRSCATATRREYRESHKVPCSHGCGAMVLHENGGKPPECHPCAMARVHGKQRAAA